MSTFGGFLFGLVLKKFAQFRALWSPMAMVHLKRMHERQKEKNNKIKIVLCNRNNLLTLDKRYKTPIKYNWEDEAKQLVLEKCCKDIDEATEKLDTKLIGFQLRSLLNMKKRKSAMPTLWKEWKPRLVKVPQYDHDFI